MKKTKVLSLLLAVFLLLSSLTLPLLAVDAETAKDPEQTQSDGADAAAADDSVRRISCCPRGQAFLSRPRPRSSSISTRAVPSMNRTRTSASIRPA